MAENTTTESTSTNKNFTISFFDKKTDAKPKEERLTWPEITKLLSEFKIHPGKDGQLFSPAKFSPARRNKENAVELSLLVLDYDHGATIDTALERWQSLGLSFVVYTTHSHQRVTEEHPKAEDRFRIVIPLIEPIPASEFPELWQWANFVSGGILDEACKDSSRMFYLPAIASKNAPHDSRSIVGGLLDWNGIELRDQSKPVDRQTARMTRYASAALNGELSRVTSAPAGNRNNALNKAAYYLGQLIAGGALKESEVVSALENVALNSGLAERETKATINSGISAGARKPRNSQVNETHKNGNGVRAPGDSVRNDKQEGPQRPIFREEGASKYEESETGLIYWQQTKDGIVPISLTNFCAQIVADVVEDDGLETRRAFEVSARLNGRSARFLVSADDFAVMKWPMVNLGAKAVIYPRRTDHARCAIQMLSDSPIERRIYTHTGWREIDGEKCYLHGGGAIGAQTVKDVEVRLPESLTPAILPNPPEGNALAEAMSAILDLARLAADEITLPAIGSVFSSVIGNADFSIWLYGPTGSGKSQFAALVQSFFGGFNADKLPGSWMSTANALEAIAHAAKDMIFVVDDFKPLGSAQDRARLNRDADRLLRAQGNQQGRQRMAADITQRKAKHPRGLIFNTAEEVPRGESLMARLFVIECQKTSLDFSQLTALQKFASNSVFASAMSGFIQWLAARYSETIERAPKEIARWRDYWAERHIANHRRYATTLGHLTYAWSLWIRAARDAGSLSEEAARELWDRVLLSLGMAGGKQDSHTNSQNPVTRFLELLQSAFASHKAHLEGITGDQPADALSWGWRRVDNSLQSSSECIGWHTGEEIYLLPDATFALLERYSANGEGIGVQQATLWKHLHEANIIQYDGKRDTYKLRRKAQGREQKVLVIRAEKLSDTPDIPDIPDIDPG